MKKIMLFLAVLFLSVSTTSAMAKDLCVQGSLGVGFVFNNVKLLKGKTTILTGRVFIGSSNAPFQGAVTVDSDNVTTRIGVIAYQGTTLIGPVLWDMVGDKFFNATGNADVAPFGSVFGPDIWTNIPCNTVLPAFPVPSPEGPSLVRPE